MISAHSKDVSSKQILDYLDDFLSGLSDKINSEDAMSSLQWRCQKLYKNNEKAFIDAMETWSLSDNNFKINAGHRLLNNIVFKISND